MSTTEITAPVNPDDQALSRMTYEQLLELETHRIIGFALTPKELLIGVPHLITRCTFWKPNRNKDGSYQLGMVSVEGVIASDAILKRAVERHWIPNVSTVAELRVDPNERVVYNDGSTGIRRQLVGLFHSMGVINVGDTDGADLSAYDRAWPDWESFAQSREQSPEIGLVPTIGFTSSGSPLMIRADRGLRVSEYTNEYTDEGVTYYLG